MGWRGRGVVGPPLGSGGPEAPLPVRSKLRGPEPVRGFRRRRHHGLLAIPVPFGGSFPAAESATLSVKNRPPRDHLTTRKNRERQRLANVASP